jgi:hypothetical protein
MSSANSIIAIVTAVVAIGTFWKALVEYRRQLTIKRFEIFQDMNRRFEDESFVLIRNFLDDNSDQLSAVEYTKKFSFIGFYEEVAIAVNRGFITLTKRGR